MGVSPECDRSDGSVRFSGGAGVGFIGRFTAIVVRLIELVLKLLESCLSGLS
jgi:hypothetical protein